jgi:hypothetical protein
MPSLNRQPLQRVQLDGDTRLSEKWRAVWQVVNSVEAGRQLANADLSDANMTGVYLREADLRDADLSGAVLKDGDLRRATLVGAKLTDADLTNVSIQMSL